MATISDNPIPTKGQPTDNGQTDPSEAQEAQIPLDTFTIPDFPPSARNLRSLILTSDIKVDEYQETLLQPFTIPILPSTIESLTLELFSLGYPPTFLSTLSTRLPNLKSLVIYSQLFAGITPESQSDAALFFSHLPHLHALHLLDVFSRPGFFATAAPHLHPNPETGRKGLLFLEVNYTSRPTDPTFLSQIQSTELPLLISPGLISCSFNISPPENAQEDEQDPTTIEEAGRREGVMALNQTLADGLVGRLTGIETRLVGLKALNITLYTLSVGQVGEVLGKHPGVMVLSFTVEMEPGEEGKKALLECFEGCVGLEEVEIVVNPSLQFIVEVQNSRTGGTVLEKTFPTEEDMVGLEKYAPNLTSFKANVLRTSSFGSVEWVKKDGKWTGGVIEGNQ